MFEYLFGNATIDKILLYLARFNEGYARQLAKNFEIAVSMAQLQLDKLEQGGVLISQLKGRTRMYSWNQRYHFKPELLQLLQKGLAALPARELNQFYTKRTKPRRRGKPLWS
jgi:hypothetical protein